MLCQLNRQNWSGDRVNTPSTFYHIHILHHSVQYGGLFENIMRIIHTYKMLTAIRFKYMAHIARILCICGLACCVLVCDDRILLYIGCPIDNNNKNKCNLIRRILTHSISTHWHFFKLTNQTHFAHSFYSVDFSSSSLSFFE